MDLPRLIALATGVFTITNIDDLLLLTALLANQRASRLAIIIGQFLGIGLITLASVGASLLAINVPARFIALLGFMPLALGLSHLSNLRGRSDDDQVAPNSSRGAVYQTIEVCALTLVSGGDNLVAYVPILATTPGIMSAFVVVSAILTAVWCIIGLVLAGHALAGGIVERWGHVLLPIMFIALGLHILSDLLTG